MAVMSAYPPPDPSWEPVATSRPSEHQLVVADDRNWSVAAHLGSFVTAWFALGLVAPLVVLLVKGGSSPFVRRHAVESLNFQINALVYSVVFGLLMFLLIGFVLLPLYAIFYLVCVVLGDDPGLERRGLPLPVHRPGHLLTRERPGPHRGGRAVRRSSQRVTPRRAVHGGDGVDADRGDDDLQEDLDPVDAAGAGHAEQAAR